MKNISMREVLAACMESPLYFALPLRKRLDLVKRMLPSSYTRYDLLNWVKTGYFNASFDNETKDRSGSGY